MVIISFEIGEIDPHEVVELVVAAVSSPHRSVDHFVFVEQFALAPDPVEETNLFFFDEDVEFIPIELVFDDAVVVPEVRVVRELS